MFGGVMRLLMLKFVRKLKKACLFYFYLIHMFEFTCFRSRKAALPNALPNANPKILRQILEQLGHSIFGENNLVPFQLWLREAWPKPEKVSLCFVQD